MAKKPTIYRVAEDELPNVSMTFTGQDLSIYSSIKMRVRLENKSLLEVDAVIDDAPNGVCHFEFADGDLVAGDHTCEWRFVRTSDSKAETFPDDGPLNFVVRPQV